MLRNQKGFTLIEIIAVLVILGILAAVAIPKYMDLQKEAKKNAMKGAVAAAVSQATMNFSKELLTASGDTSTAWNALNATTICTDVKTEGFTPVPTWNCTKSATEFNATITSGDVTASGKFTRPI